MTKNLKTDYNLFPLFSACKKDLDVLKVNFRLDQDAIMNSLLKLGHLKGYNGVYVAFKTTVMEYRQLVVQ